MMKKNFIELNLGLIFMGTSGVMGRSIDLVPPLGVWWRCVIGALFLGLYCWISKIGFGLDIKRDWKALLGSSILLMIHWVTYFYALQWSNVAIALLTLYTYPVISTILEPLILKVPFLRIHMVLAILVLIGVYIMLPEYQLESNMIWGVIAGLVSAVFFALRNIYSKELSISYNSSLLIFVQLGICAFVMLPVPIVFDAIHTPHQWPAIIFLGLVTTALGHTLFVRGFISFSVSTVSLIASIIPIYGILLAFIFLKEVPDLKTIIGGTIILSTVVAEAWRLHMASQINKI